MSTRHTIRCDRRWSFWLIWCWRYKLAGYGTMAHRWMSLRNSSRCSKAFKRGGKFLCKDCQVLLTSSSCFPYYLQVCDRALIARPHLQPEMQICKQKRRRRTRKKSSEKKRKGLQRDENDRKISDSSNVLSSFLKAGFKPTNYPHTKNPKKKRIWKEQRSWE
jgi:hypothetical protein